jgi:uncharacterized HAD superfamily protein
MLENFSKFKDRLTIGFDIDGCVQDFVGGFLSYLNKKYNKLLTTDDVLDYYWYECVDWLTEEMFWESFHEFGKDGGYFGLKLYHGFKETLDFVKDNHNYYFITHRPDYAYEDTVRFLGNNFYIPEDKIIFAPGNKSVTVNRLGVDVFIDDSPKTLMDLRCNTDAYVFCMDHLYNRHLTNEEVHRVHNWSEFLEELKSLRVAK